MSLFGLLQRWTRRWLLYETIAEQSLLRAATSVMATLERPGSNLQMLDCFFRATPVLSFELVSPGSQAEHVLAHKEILLMNRAADPLGLTI